jgi:hypothetical protein
MRANVSLDVDDLSKLELTGNSLESGGEQIWMGTHSVASYLTVPEVRRVASAWLVLAEQMEAR